MTSVNGLVIRNVRSIKTLRNALVFFIGGRGACLHDGNSPAGRKGTEKGQVILFRDRLAGGPGLTGNEWSIVNASIIILF